MLTGTGKLPIAVPRDRLATFEPQLIAKYRRRLPGFDDKVVSMYARGMTVREIQQAGGARLFSPVTAANPVGNAGRNILRADGLNRLDLGVVKNFRVREKQTLQLTGNFFSATNTRDWGIPEARITAGAFLNEGATEVPARRIQVGLRYAF